MFLFSRRKVEHLVGVFAEYRPFCLCLGNIQCRAKDGNLSSHNFFNHAWKEGIIEEFKKKNRQNLPSKFRFSTKNHSLNHLTSSKTSTHDFYLSTLKFLGFAGMIDMAASATNAASVSS